MSLYAGFPCQDRLGNDIYTDFRNMLRLDSILDNPEWKENEKAFACLTLLYGADIPRNIEAAYGELLWFYHRGDVPEKPKARLKKLFDFEEDAPYIVGAFLSEYKLDLTSEAVYLHWWQFMALFLALPDDTPMMKRMCDRNIDLSKLKGETRKYYEQRQRAVALKTAKRVLTGTPDERLREKQRRLDALYAQAQAQKALEERGGADAG